jgi:hypothetical protein
MAVRGGRCVLHGPVNGENVLNELSKNATKRF